MLGSKIIVTANPLGVFQEGVISGTPKPGTMMQVQNGTAAVFGRLTYEVYNPSASGDPRVCWILLEDDLQGKTTSDAYVSGTRGFLYCPIGGEEMNVLTKGQAGTGSANAFTVGERLEAEKGSGKFIQQTSSSGNALFQVLEHIDQVPDTDTLIWCAFQGNQ